MIALTLFGLSSGTVWERKTRTGLIFEIIVIWPCRFWAWFGLGVGTENADRGVYFDTGTSGVVKEDREGRGAAGGRQDEEVKEGWKSADENENPHTEGAGIIKICGVERVHGIPYTCPMIPLNGPIHKPLLILLF